MCIADQFDLVEVVQYYLFISRSLVKRNGTYLRGGVNRICHL